MSVTSPLNEKRSTLYGSLAINNNDEIESPLAQKERVWTVALCSFSACLASVLTGLMLSCSSPTLAELEEETDPSRRIVANETAASLFAVRLNG